MLLSKCPPQHKFPDNMDLNTRARTRYIHLIEHSCRRLFMNEIESIITVNT